jgi:hypothetical protein
MLEHGVYEHVNVDNIGLFFIRLPCPVSLIFITLTEINGRADSGRYRRGGGGRYGRADGGEDASIVFASDFNTSVAVANTIKTTATTTITHNAAASITFHCHAR